MTETGEESSPLRLRRTWLLALWAAEAMGLSGTTASLYAHNLQAALGPDCPADQLVIHLHKDLLSVGLSLPPEQIGHELERVESIIRGQILQTS